MAVPSPRVGRTVRSAAWRDVSGSANVRRRLATHPMVPLPCPKPECRSCSQRCSLPSPQSRRRQWPRTSTRFLIYFDEFSANLTQKSRDVIADAAKQARESNAKAIRVEARASATGSATANKYLAHDAQPGRCRRTRARTASTRQSCSRSRSARPARKTPASPNGASISWSNAEPLSAEAARGGPGGPITSWRPAGRGCRAAPVRSRRCRTRRRRPG